MTNALKTPTRQTIAPAGHWTADTAHSSVEFAVKHLVIATIKGRFLNFAGTLDVDPATGDVYGDGVVNVASIDTAEPKRDEHLRSPDFFHAERYPEITFTLRDTKPLRGNRHLLEGEITIRGVRRQLVLEATVSETAYDPWGNDRLAIDLTGKLSRKAFGLRWNQMVEAGPVVGDEVSLSVSLSLVRETV